MELKWGAPLCPMPSDLVSFMGLQTPRKLSHPVRRETCTSSVIYGLLLSSDLEREEAVDGEAAGIPGLSTVTCGHALSL